MKCANRGLFVCLSPVGWEGARERKWNDRTLLTVPIFQCFGVRDNDEVWIGERKGITFCCLYPCLSCKRKRSDCSKQGSLQFP